MNTLELLELAKEINGQTLSDEDQDIAIIAYTGDTTTEKMIPLLERYLELEEKRIEIGDILDWADTIKGVLGTEYADRVTQEEARIAWAIRVAND